jgi:hypothetical protein
VQGQHLDDVDELSATTGSLQIRCDKELPPESDAAGKGTPQPLLEARAESPEQAAGVSELHPPVAGVTTLPGAEEVCVADLLNMVSCILCASTAALA